MRIRARWRRARKDKVVSPELLIGAMIVVAIGYAFSGYQIGPPIGQVRIIQASN